MRPSEILAEMLLDEANPVDWAKQTWGNFKQSKLAQNLWLTKQPEKKPRALTAPVTPAGKITHIAVVYGPKLPETGYYMTGPNEKLLLDKLKKAMKQVLGNRAASKRATTSTDYSAIVNSWIVNGYQMYMSNRGTGVLHYFGEKPRDLDRKTAKLLGASVTKAMNTYQRAGQAPRAVYPNIV